MSVVFRIPGGQPCVCNSCTENKWPTDGQFVKEDEARRERERRTKEIVSERTGEMGEDMKTTEQCMLQSVQRDDRQKGVGRQKKNRDLEASLADSSGHIIDRRSISLLSTDILLFFAL